MTYCVPSKVSDGLVALADGRPTSGTQVTVGRKITLHGEGQQSFVTTSGLRSVREKTRADLDCDLKKREGHNFPNMLDAVDGFVTHMRAVARSDQEYLEDFDLKFNLHALSGGKLEKDYELTSTWSIRKATGSGPESGLPTS